MKNRVLAVLMVLSLLAVAGAAHAQTLTFKAHVPFPFVVGNQTLPAGTYQIQRLRGRPTDADQIGIILVRNDDFPIVPLYKAVVTNLLRQSPSSGSSSQLVFASHAGQRYLSDVRIDGEKGHQIPNVSRQSELVGFDASQEEVVVAALR